VSLDSAHWRILLFGRLQAQCGDLRRDHLAMRRMGALLACLVMRAPHPVPREELLELLWPEEAPSITRNRLSVLLNSLKRQFGPIDLPCRPLLTIKRSTIELIAPHFTSDYQDFQVALEAARGADSVRDRIASLERAVLLARGELLSGFYDAWILTERARLDAMRREALRDLVHAFLQNDDPAGAIEYARQAVAADALNEEAHYDLIAVYRQIGQPSAALRQFAQLERVLADELQARPSPATCALARQIEADLGHGWAPAGRPLRPMTIRAKEHLRSRADGAERLPARLTRFFGREAEIASLCNLLDRSGATRLVTLLGPGGTGKTRLALETADRLAERYAGRVYFVSLAEINDIHNLGAALARSLHLPPAPELDVFAQALIVLNAAPSLLILDNLEHLLPDAGPMIERLLQDAVELRCLLTSRAPAGVEGEQEIALAPLPLPTDSLSLEILSACPGIALFVDRARLVRADFALSNQNAEDVVQLCRALDGLPLAIELAAARSRVMTPAEMRTQSKQILPLLVDVQGGKPARHRSLRSTVEWSYRLLPVEAQRCFNALCVCTGGFTVEVAGRIAFASAVDNAAARDMLEQLRVASFLTLTDTEEQTTRFRILETLREFGLEHLARSDQESAVRQRHLAYYAGRLGVGPAASAVDQDVGNSTAPGWFACEEDNLRGALEFGLNAGAGARHTLLAVALAVRLSDYWEKQGRWAEGLTYLQRALALPEVTLRPTLRVDALRAAGLFANLQGHGEQARLYSEEGLARAREADYAPGIAGCLVNLGNVAFTQDDYAGARDRFEQALALYRQTGRQAESAACLSSLGNVAFFLGDQQAATERLDEALGIYQQLGDTSGAASVLLRLGNVKRNQNRFAEAHAHLEEALELFRSVNYRYGVASCLHSLGLAAFFQGQAREAEALYREAMQIFQEIGYRRGVGSSLSNLGNVAQGRGDYPTALRYYSQAMQIYQALADRRDMAACLFDLGNVALEQADWAEAEKRYQNAFALEQKIHSRGGIANCLGALGRLALEQNLLVDAAGRLEEALHIYQEMNIPAGVADMLQAYAHLAHRLGRSAAGVQLAGAAEALRRQFGFFRVLCPVRWQAALTAMRAALPQEAFDAAYRQGEALTAEQAIAAALQLTAQLSSSP